MNLEKFYKGLDMYENIWLIKVIYFW